GRITSFNDKDLIVHQYDIQGTLTIASQIEQISKQQTRIMGLTIAGSGVVVVSGNNTFGGFVSVNDGFLSIPNIANGGVGSPLGTSSNAATNVILNRGTLRYTGI